MQVKCAYVATWLFLHFFLGDSSYNNWRAAGNSLEVPTPHSEKDILFSPRTNSKKACKIQTKYPKAFLTCFHFNGGKLCGGKCQSLGTSENMTTASTHSTNSQNQFGFVCFFNCHMRGNARLMPEPALHSLVCNLCKASYEFRLKLGSC